MKTIKIKLLVLPSLLAIIFTGCTIIDEGQVGVRTWWGKTGAPEKSVKLPGMHGTFFGARTYKFNTRTQKLDYQTMAYTKDIQQATLDITVTFRLQSDKVVNTFKQYGTRWEEVIIMQNLQDIIKAEIGQWEAAELIANRSEATQNTERRLQESFSSRNLPVDIEGYSMRDISFEPAFEAAVEAKVTAMQDYLKEQNNTLRMDEQNKQTINRAQADAEAMNVLGNALRQNPRAIDWRIVEKWDGKLPLSDGRGIISIPTVGNQR